MAAKRRNNRHADRDIHHTNGRQATAWIRIPIDVPKGRRLRVLIYARFSTEEQNPRSIEDQVAYCKRFLDGLGLKNFEIAIRILSDEAMSGELVSRPGIDVVRTGFSEKRWDLALAEDSGRFFRHETACGELIETAVDAGVRVVCINDYIDTAEPDWDDRLHEASRHHAKANRYTARRISRAHEALWEMGAAVGALKPGYLRKASHPATERERAEGPFFDEIDPVWAPVIQSAFEWSAAGDFPETVAERLTALRLPKTANSKHSHWTDKNVIALIRRPIYRGLDTFRDTISKKVYRTGKRRPELNAPDDVLTREMPHLRIVSDHLWYKANDAINERISTNNRTSGPDHPLWNVPRGSRMPLSQILVCGICGERTHVIGSNGYRCRETAKGVPPEYACWNHASAKCENAHAAIQNALLKQIGQLKESTTQKVILDVIGKLLAGDSQTTVNHDSQRLRLREEQQKLENGLKNLLDIAEQGISTGNPTLDSLAVRIDQREEKLARISAELEDLDAKSDVCLTAKDLTDRIEEFVERLERFDRDIQDDLKQLVGTIEAVPHQQFGNDKVVLRGRFVFNAIELLPARVRLALQKLHGDRIDDLLPDCLKPVAILVDLFERSTGPKYWKQALDLHDSGLGLTAVGKEIGITKRKAHLAIQYGKALREAGVTDPFTELTEPPANASRWGSRRGDNSASSDP